jgi:cytochrome c oxidase subunit 2
MNRPVGWRRWILFAVTAAARGETPMSYLHTHGPAADPVTRLGWGLGIVSLVVIAVIVGLLAGAMFRRRRAGDPAALAVRSDSGGVSWIYVGAGISTVVLAGCMVWTMVVTAAVGRPPSRAALTIEVTASQWWWSIRYPNAIPDRTFTTANEIHVPVGQPVRDVIHSFWIPQLAGKMDVIPGQTNVSWLEAGQPGEYRGQCAAFCGVQHAHMAMRVVADSAADFAEWQVHQRADGREAVADQARRGEEVFRGHCAVCHTIRGVTPAGIRGPDLTHLMTRRTLAAGSLPNSAGELERWIADAQSIKPGAAMPRQVLTGAELSDVTNYLRSLN